MKVLSTITDHRINCNNIFAEVTFREYLSFANKIIKNNDLQRKRVHTSKTVYSLLKTDLERGCVIPPLVLAITEQYTFEGQTPEEKGAHLLDFIEKNDKKVLILDGLQRTFTLIDADFEMSTRNPEQYEIFLNNTLRLEIYNNINKFGILYRMLTLNTGQTPMSTRHQLEMLYNDLLDAEIAGIKLLADTDGNADPNKNEFNFSNIIGGFNSYIKRNEQPIDRQDMLDSLNSLENMAQEDVDKDLFQEFIENYAYLFNSLKRISNNHVLSEEELQNEGINYPPYNGYTAAKLFSTPQALSGFGSAIGKMKDRGILDLNSIPSLADKLQDLYTKECHDWLLAILFKLNTIRNESKKIGNAQRMFFHYFFRELFNEASDSYLDLTKAADNGYDKYISLS